MWFTLTGRLHTRLTSFTGPLLLTLVVATITGDSDYWLLFALMASVGIVLEMGVYGWLIGYQPRWLTIVLGIVEFLLLKWIVEWPYPFEIRLHTRQALSFYIVAWLLMWITTQAVLPILWPRLAEDGGEFRSVFTIQMSRRSSRFGDLPARRSAYLISLAALVVVTLPWLVGLARTPQGHRFIGILGLESMHVQALTDITLSSRSSVVYSPGYLLGQIARLGRWSTLTSYFVAWIIVGFVWLLGIQTFLAQDKHRSLLVVTVAALPVLLLPVTWLLPANVVLWLAILAPRSKLVLDERLSRVTASLVAFVVLLWILAWLRVLTAPYAYVSEDIWQALTWLNQSVSPSTTVVAPTSLGNLVRAFGGQQAPTGELTESTYVLFVGVECAKVSPLFAHGQVCIAMQETSMELESASSAQQPMNLEDRINHILTNRDWGLIDQADRLAWQELMNDVAASIGQSDDATSVDQERLDRAVIGAYCPILHAACSDEGSLHQRRAFEELWHWVYPRVRQRVDTDQDAEDVAQQVMLKVYQNLHQVTDPRGFLAWVNKITFRTLADHYRRKGRRDRVEQFIFDVETDSEKVDELAAVSDSLEMELSLAEEELVRMIYECMPERKRRQTEVLVALVFEQLSVPEVADRLQTTPANVYILYHRARRDLPKHCRHLMEQLLQHLAPSQRFEHAETDPCH